MDKITEPKIYKWSRESRKKVSEMRRGIPKSEAHKAAIGDGNRGKQRTEEQRQVYSEASAAAWARKKAKQAALDAIGRDDGEQ